jgi:hypothetical protein
MNCRPVAWIRGLLLFCFAACLICALAQTISGGNLIALTPGFVLEQSCKGPQRAPAPRRDAAAPSDSQPAQEAECEWPAPPLPRTDTLSRWL